MDKQEKYIMKDYKAYEYKKVKEIFNHIFNVYGLKIKNQKSLIIFLWNGWSGEDNWRE